MAEDGDHRAEMATSIRLPVHTMVDHTGNIYRVTYDGNLPTDAVDFPARLTAKGQGQEHAGSDETA